jgi:hypothetical protein
VTRKTVDLRRFLIEGAAEAEMDEADGVEVDIEEELMF